MKTIFIILFSVLSIQYTIGQTKENSFNTTPSSGPLLEVDQIPEFPGGISKLGEFLQNNLRYPKAARKANITGKVFASFVVDAKGRIKDISIAKGLGYGCDEEVIRVIRLMPKWKPGIKDNKAVPVRFSLPISFSLSD
ncbi:energy transducer TonB [Xanthocytophaga agilis]|uniref:Energy transducer TonB n=1 Tax=Xanthocytophaga agilis TaxID=3048010 RepID=A0AAE3R840_9BACT|nr:energy transducer TonB [Xanthocytophaga agilis]MDJ1503134.1 energy transducer TonB [Xanthocytophaga agilis]